MNGSIFNIILGLVLIIIKVLNIDLKLTLLLKYFVEFIPIAVRRLGGILVFKNVGQTPVGIFILLNYIYRIE